jgi:hypothetical protein
MPRQYTMDEATRIARRAARDIYAWLSADPRTVRVRNVEDDPAFRRVDVDLICETRRRAYKIEIKGDRWHTTGNFFFETLSNREKATPGCFLYTQADFVFYYFVATRLLYILPMPTTRDWFLTNIARFPERATTTPVGKDAYTTVGRLVPIAVVLREVAGVKKRQLSPPLQRQHIPKHSQKDRQV